MDLRSVKQRFEIIGNNPMLNRAIDIAVMVAPTNVSVLINGESGTGKENIPKIIHAFSSRKHASYIAVNCGAIPEGTIDSELFGHEKGSFTGATDSRKGYFEEANGGTIFLDEVAELPLQTQVRLLRVLETGEYLRVGSSKVQKTNVRVVAATNVNFDHALREGKFREDLYYRLNQVPVYLPPLRERREDILPLFAKFSADFSDKYKTPLIELTPDAQMALVNYTWPGNIRQLRNITEQINILEQDRLIGAEKLLLYLPQPMKLEAPALVRGNEASDASLSEREILYKVLFEMRNEINDLKQVLAGMMNPDHAFAQDTKNQEMVSRLFPQESNLPTGISMMRLPQMGSAHEVPVEIEETLSLANSERELIEKALKKHRNKRKYAAKELGISERTLYRKIKEYGIED